ncbi:MAG: hypothetical protein K0V04_13725 [Deltaproteobacteria bacterium]|nr:hypothetical protein [Deltaproteobacteria bacterium]
MGVNQNTASSRLRAARAAFERACAQVNADGIALSPVHVRQAHEQPPPPRALQRGWVASVARLVGPAPVTTTAGTTAAASVTAQGKALALTVAIGISALGMVALTTPTADATVAGPRAVIDAPVDLAPAPREPGPRARSRTASLTPARSRHAAVHRPAAGHDIWQ